MSEHLEGNGRDTDMVDVVIDAQNRAVAKARVDVAEEGLHLVRTGHVLHGLHVLTKIVENKGQVPST